MKKTFLLTDEKKEPQRVLESIKHDIRKYIKREKRKDLVSGSNFWKINAKFGKTEDSIVEIRFVDIMKNITEASEQNWASFHIQLISEAGTMNFKKKEKSENKEVSQLDNSEVIEDNIEFEDEN